MPEYRNKGYAQIAIREAEKIHGVGNWSLDTILQEKGNLYLYEKNLKRFDFNLKEEIEQVHKK